VNDGPLLIGQLATRCGLSASALRFYDECGLLTPARLDPQNGYRHYEPAQVDIARLIRDLRAAGMAVADVRRFLSADTADRRRLLQQRESALTHGATTAREHLRRVALTLTSQETDMSTTSITVQGADLLSALEHLLPICSSDDELPLLKSLLVEAAEGSLRLVATDRFRLAVRDLAPIDGRDTTFKVLIPSASARRAVTALQTAVGPVEVFANTEHLGLRNPDVVLPLIKADYIDYEPLLTGDPVEHVLLAGLDDLISAVTDHAGEHVVLTFQTDGLRVGGQVVSATYEGAGVSLAVNPAYLLEALRGASGPEVALEASTAARPLVIRSADHGAQIHLLMPIKLETE
jgi:DNA-binding transcriptional MerR regulator